MCVYRATCVSHFFVHACVFVHWDRSKHRTFEDLLSIAALVGFQSSLFTVVSYCMFLSCFPDFPVTRQRNYSRAPSTTGGESEGDVEMFECVCGREFTSLRGRNIHRGKCLLEVDVAPQGPSPVSSGGEFGPVDNHSAEDTTALLKMNTEFVPPASRNRRVNWPSGTDYHSRWGEYEEVVAGRLRDAQAGCLYQVRMEVHCTVVYEVGLEMFGLVEVKKGGRKEPFRSRRCRLIESLVAERRVVRAEREVG